jgi:hypothetical protein
MDILPLIAIATSNGLTVDEAAVLLEGLSLSDDPLTAARQVEAAANGATFETRPRMAQ